MKNSLKKRFPWEKQFSLPGISDKWKKRFFASQKNSFYQGPWSFSVKIGFRIISIMVTTSKKNTIILKNTISPRQKRILQLLFSLLETVIEIRKNQVFFKNNLLWKWNFQWKLEGIQFLKVTLYWLGTDARAFFLLVESISISLLLEIIIVIKR